jgi:hypothetical protein
MSRLTQVVSELQAQRKEVEKDLARLDAALRALTGSQERKGTSNNGLRVVGIRRKLSAAARKRIAAAQKARWAKWRSKQTKAA